MNKLKVFSVVVVVFAMFLYHIWQSNFFPRYESIVTHPIGSYDFIIVGGGTAGCVLANRLSADNKNRVLLLEAGGLPPFISSVPLASPFLQGGPYDWNYNTVPQKRSLKALNNHVSKWPRGKMLGGTGQINFHINNLNIKEDLQEWTKIAGLLSWNKTILSKYIARMFCETPNSDGREPSIWNYSNIRNCSRGHVRVSTPQSRISEIFHQALTELRIEQNSTVDQVNLVKNEMNIFKGKRWNTFEGYLKPVLNRNNLHVVLHSMVTKVLFSNKKAIGIHYLDKTGKPLEVYLNDGGEILLSGGAINSPQILLLSGIGPKKHLQQMKITQISDLPVGYNLQDHLVVPLRVSIKKPLSINGYKIKSLGTLAQYLVFGKGFLASSGIDGSVITSTKRMHSMSQDNFRLMSLLFNMGSIDPKYYTEASNIPLESYEKWFPGADDETAEGFIMLSICLNPKSKGTVVLKSTDPLDSPSIDPNYLDNEEDIQCLIEAIRLSSLIVQTKAFDSIGAKIQLPRFEDCGIPDIKDVSYLVCLVRHTAITMYHPVGTAFMGKGGVVDEDLRVKNCTGLRVIDASALPSLPSGAPNTPIIFIAERASDIILKGRMKND